MNLKRFFCIISRTESTVSINQKLMPNEVSWNLYSTVLLGPSYPYFAGAKSAKFAHFQLLPRNQTNYEKFSKLTLFEHKILYCLLYKGTVLYCTVLMIL